MAEKIIVIGNGIAAVTAAKAIREYDKTSEITMFGEESYYPYNRIRLSKGLVDTLEEEKILLQKKAWYEDNSISLYLNSQVVTINTENRRLMTLDGKHFSYTKLLIASGAHNFIPLVQGLDKQGVFTLRTLNDAWGITAYAKDKNTILNIGGGIQGLETAWILSQMGKQVIIAELANRLMPRQLDERASQILKKAAESCGITILTDTKVSEITGSKEVQGFGTAEKEALTCDMVIYSAGIQPNTELFKGTSIQINQGVIVNEKMETNLEGIYAAGDIAEFRGEIYGLWNIAIGHGKTAGYNIAGKKSIYEPIVPVTTLNAFNLALFSMGKIEEAAADHIILEDRTEESLYNKVYIKNNKVIGAIVIGNIKYSPLLKTAIEKEILLKDEALKKMSFDEILEFIKDKK